MNQKEEKEMEKKEKKGDQNDDSLPKGEFFYKISSILDERRKELEIPKRKRRFWDEKNHLKNQNTHSGKSGTHRMIDN